MTARELDEDDVRIRPHRVRELKIALITPGQS
jgi:hypothetical protein